MRNLTMLLEKIKIALESCHLFSELEADYFYYVLDHLSYALVWTLFNPGSTASFAAKRRLCREMRDHEIYKRALRLNCSCGPLRRRVLLFPFYMKWYRVENFLCWLSHVVWKWRRKY